MPEEKRQRPQLASVIVEAVKIDSLQKLCSTLEPLLRRVVGEEVERALAKFAPPKVGVRISCLTAWDTVLHQLRFLYSTATGSSNFVGADDIFGA
jgi:hypothetical protein